MEEPRFSACGYALTFDSPEATLRTIRGAGFSGIEGNDTVVEGRDPAELRSLARQAEQQGAPFTSYHLPFTANHDIAAFYETDRLEAVRLTEEAMHRAELLGAGTVILHPTTKSYDVDVEGVEAYQERLCRSLEHLVRSAEALKLRIAVENMMNSSRAVFFSRPEHIRGFRERFDHGRVGFCLDTGHALISLGIERQLDMMDAMQGKLIALHLQDCPGDRDIHIAPGRGNVDFRGIFNRVRRDGIDEVLCIETAPFAPERPYSDESWARLVRETAALAKL